MIAGLTSIPSFSGIRTNARKDGDDWIINGSKIYITNGWLTDTCIVVAKVGPESGCPDYNPGMAKNFLF